MSLLFDVSNVVLQNACFPPPVGLIKQSSFQFKSSVLFTHLMCSNQRQVLSQLFLQTTFFIALSNCGPSLCLGDLLAKDFLFCPCDGAIQVNEYLV
ncbi:hypothetical protein ASD71_26130 [Achromobacter sp. Root565]|nr:hypothetical protein ASD71_26130 [Achromobacter sp. Root565]